MELQNMLASELVGTKSFHILERKELDADLTEQDLGASGRIDQKTRAKIGAIKGAKYLVAGTVSAYGEDTSGTGDGIGFFGVSIGEEQKKTYIAVDLSKYEKTPTGKTIRACLIEITEYLQCSLTKGKDDSCMQQYAAKDTKRKEKTKKTIELE